MGLYTYIEGRLKVSVLLAFGGVGGLPSLLPEDVCKDRDAMAFLLRIGLRKEIDDLPFLIMCARSLARVQQTWKAQGWCDCMLCAFCCCRTPLEARRLATN